MREGSQPDMVGRRSHCSGVLIHDRVFLTAGHRTGPGEFPKPSFFALFVSLAADALDQTTWIGVAEKHTDPGSGMIKWRVVTHPSIPPCPGPPGCDPTTQDIFHASDPGIQATALVFLEQPVRHIARGKLAVPGVLETRKGARTPMTIVGYPLPSPDAEEADWDGLRRFRRRAWTQCWTRTGDLVPAQQRVLRRLGRTDLPGRHPGGQKGRASSWPTSATGASTASARTPMLVSTPRPSRSGSETIREVLQSRRRSCPPPGRPREWAPEL